MTSTEPAPEVSPEAEAGYERAVADAAERHRQQDAEHGHVHRALWAVMRDVTWIGKTERMDQGRGGRYDFRSIDQVIAALGRAARAHGLALASRHVAGPEYAEHEVSKSGGGSTRWTTCRGLVIEWSWTSLVDGSTISAIGVGEGRDSGDKATNKAMTAAYKYALTQSTMLPTFQPDPDGADPQLDDDGQGNSQGDDGPDYSPDEVLQAIRGAQNTGLLDEIEGWLKARDLMGYEEDGQTFDAHLTAARRTLAGAST